MRTILKTIAAALLLPGLAAANPDGVGTLEAWGGGAVVGIEQKGSWNDTSAYEAHYTQNEHWSVGLAGKAQVHESLSVLASGGWSRLTSVWTETADGGANGRWERDYFDQGGYAQAGLRVYPSAWFVGAWAPDKPGNLDGLGYWPFFEAQLGWRRSQREASFPLYTGAYSLLPPTPYTDRVDTWSGSFTGTLPIVSWVSIWLGYDHDYIATHDGTRGAFTRRDPWEGYRVGATGFVDMWDPLPGAALIPGVGRKGQARVDLCLSRDYSTEAGKALSQAFSATGRTPFDDRWVLCLRYTLQQQLQNPMDSNPLMQESIHQMVEHRIDIGLGYSFDRLAR